MLNREFQPIWDMIMQTVEDILQEKIANSKMISDTRAVTLYKVIEEFAILHDCLYDFDKGSEIKGLYTLLDEKVPAAMTNSAEITAAIKGTESNSLLSLASRLINRSMREKSTIPDLESIRAKVVAVFPAPVLSTNDLVNHRTTQTLILVIKNH